MLIASEVRHAEAEARCHGELIPALIRAISGLSSTELLLGTGRNALTSCGRNSPKLELISTCWTKGDRFFNSYWKALWIKFLAEQTS